MLSTHELYIRGLVQGVLFRKYSLQTALQLGLTGFVKNLPDQSVYIVVTGSKDQLTEFEKCCWQGSPRSKVSSIEVKDLPLQEFSSFVIER